MSHRPAGDPADPHGLASLMAAHCDWLTTSGYAASTIEQRERYLSKFLAWAAERAIGRADDITRPVLERYQRYLFHCRKPNGDPLTLAAQKQRLIPLRVFFRWCFRYGHIASNPAAEIQLPKVERRLPKAVLTAAEVEQILSVPDVDYDLGLRDRAILELLYATGMRRSEVTNLKLFSLDHASKRLVVREGKGKKDRVIPVSERALTWLKKYIDDVRPTLVFGHDERWVFLTDDGHPLTPNHLSSRVRGYIIKADIGKTGSCHIFRHSMATLMLENGADIRYIQQMLGHSDIQSTQIYTRVAIGQLQRVYEDTHPGVRAERLEE